MTKRNKIENRGGVIIIVIIGLLAIMKVINSNLEEEIANANLKHLSYSSWYSAKSIKQVLKENQRDLLTSLLHIGAIKEESLPELNTRIDVTNNLILKYEEEKTEILLGSANIPRSSWSQDLDGEMGKIIGLRKWQEISTNYSYLVSKIDIGTLFLQISIVFGVLGLVINDNLKLQQVFTGLMIATGIIGMVVCFYFYSFFLV